MAQLFGSTLVSFVGYQGSGKSLLGRKLARVLCTDHIETSDLVKATHGEGLSRSQLSSTAVFTEEDPAWLGKEVGADMSRIMDEQNRNVVVISGVREPEVHKYLQREGVGIWPIEVHADPTIRYKRLIELGKVKTTEEFLDQDIRERQLGLPKILSRCKFLAPTSDDSNPDNLVKAIKLLLESKGAKF